MTIIEGDAGVTIVDPMISAETAKVGLELYYANRGQKLVKAVILYLYGPPRVCKKKIIVYMKEKLQSYIRPLD